MNLEAYVIVDGLLDLLKEQLTDLRNAAKTKEDNRSLNLALKKRGEIKKLVDSVGFNNDGD